MNGLIFNDDGSIRGSFINMCLTLLFAVVIAFGAFCKEVSDNLKNMETLMLGFYAISFGIWAGKKVYERKLGMCEGNDDVVSKP